MSSEPKNQHMTSDFEVDSQDLHAQSKLRTVRVLDSSRVGLTVLALLFGITIIGVSGDALAVYDATHVSSDLFLPLWPDQFDLRPTVALVVGSALVILANIVSLLFSKVKFLRNRTLVHTSTTFVAPATGLIAAIIAIAFFYSVNTSTTDDTLLSWSCRWEEVVMTTKPHFNTLCKQSRAGLYLSILLIPLEAIVLGIAAYQMSVERTVTFSAHGRRKSGSPVPSSSGRQSPAADAEAQTA